MTKISQNHEISNLSDLKLAPNITTKRIHFGTKTKVKNSVLTPVTVIPTQHSEDENDDSTAEKHEVGIIQEVNISPIEPKYAPDRMAAKTNRLYVKNLTRGQKPKLVISTIKSADKTTEYLENS